MAKKSVVAASEDPNEALGRWLAQRQGAKGEYRKILNERENELLEASARCGPKSNSFLELTRESEEARLQLDEIHGVVRRPLNRHAVKWAHLTTFIVVLALLESAVNKFLFDVTLGSYGFVSYATAFVVSFLMVLVAHVAGRCFRQVYSDYRGKVIWANLAAAVIITAVLATVVCILTVGRALTAANASIGSFEDVFSAVSAAVGESSLWSIVGSAFSQLNPLILATVNIAGIFAAMILAFVMHDPDKDYDLAASKVEHVRSGLEKLDETYTRAKTKLVAKYASYLSAASTRFKTANKEVMQLKHRLGAAADPDDHLLIDDWDDLAETSGLIDRKGEREDTAPGQKPPHLKPVETEARRA